MIGALERLRPGYGAEPLPDQLAAFGISGKTRRGLLRLFTTHPSIEERIERLRQGVAAR
jgi:heat shock protein HtpX